MGTARIGHVVERTFIHLFSSGGVFLLALCGLRLAERHAPWPPLPMPWPLFLAALAPFTVISLREIWDVKNGGWFHKSWIDWLSWASGLGLCAWAMHWLAPWVAR